MRLLAERQDPAEMFTLRTGETVRHVPLRDILFFETSSMPHHVLLHTANSRMDFLGSLNELEIRLGNRFIRTRRAYLVAAYKIETIDLKHNILWAGGNFNVHSGNLNHTAWMIWYVYNAGRQNGNGGKHMEKERFVEVYNQGIVNVARVIMDTETGVNYLMASHNKANGFVY